MNKIIRRLTFLAILLVLLVGVLAASPLRALAAPVSAGHAATLPPTTCVLSGPNERTCELWARAGTLALPDGVTVPIWGYADTVGGAAQLPGPAIVANEGETLIVILHNELAQNTSLSFPGQPLAPDMTGAAPGGTVTYTFVADAPGTFSYEAGLTPNGARQVAMGLFGALVVRPAGHPDWAYGAATAFDDEALLVLSEIDPDFNNDPANFNLIAYAPEYWLINGQAYPDVPDIATAAGHTVLLRFLNAGVMQHSLGLLGLHQRVIANDGRPLAHPYWAVAESIAAGQSLDALVTVPVAAPPGVRYALYEAGHHTRNASQTLSPGGPYAFGGAFTFLAVPSAPPGPDVLGPLVSDAMVMPELTAGMMGVTLTATLSELTTGNANVVAAEYFTDTVGAPGSGAPFTVGAPAPTVDVAAFIPPEALADLMTGMHTFYLRGQDSLGNWGPLGAASFELVMAGPMITGMELIPSPTNGTRNVRVQATGDARPSGSANVVAAEYFVDTAGAPGTGAPMALNRIAPVVSLTATIPLGDVSAMPEGIHPILIRALDSLDNWGEVGQVDLWVDKTGPSVSSVTVWPNPNNGYQGLLPTIPAVRLEAVLGDPVVGGVNSDLDRAEGFIDAPGADGSGFPLMSVDGVYNDPNETGYVFIPLFTIRQLTPGAHTFYVHGRDAAGNWGPYGTTVLIVDTAAPVVGGLALSPTSPGTSGIILLGVASDPANPGGAPASNVVAAEWFEGADPGNGLGHPVAAADGLFDSPTENLRQAISVIGWRPGDHVLRVRARDAAGNWGVTSPITVTVRRIGGNGIFADDFQSGDLSAWAASVGPVSVVPQAGMGGTTLGMAAVVNGSAPAYVVDTTPNYEARYRAQFYFHPNGTDTAGGQHDIFVAFDDVGTPIFGIQFEHSAARAGYEVRAWARTDGGLQLTDWFEIANAPHLLGLDWESSAAGTLRLAVDGVTQRTLSGLDTRLYLVDEVRLGPSQGLTDGMSGTEYFDEFNAIRAIFDTYLPVIVRQ